MYVDLHLLSVDLKKILCFMIALGSHLYLRPDIIVKCSNATIVFLVLL